MIKPTSIFFTTLMSVVEAIQVRDLANNEGIPEEILKADRAEALAESEWTRQFISNVGANNAEMTEAADPVLMLKSQAGKFTPKDCYAGIERYKNGPSNS